MAPIKIKWDPEILAAGFRPSSIFDEMEAGNITTVAATDAPATVDVVGVQSAAAAVDPAHNVTVAAIREAMERVVALVVNSTTTTTTPSSTVLAPSWTTTTTTTPGWTTPTTIQRAVERMASQPEVVVAQVRINIFEFYRELLVCFWCRQAKSADLIIFCSSF